MVEYRLKTIESKLRELILGKMWQVSLLIGQWGHESLIRRRCFCCRPSSMTYMCVVGE